MKVLNDSDLQFVSGGRGNNGGDRRDNGGGCASRVGNDALHGALAGGYAGIISGGIAGLPGGPEGVALGAIGGFARGAIRGAAIEGVRSYATNCGNDRGGALGGDSSRNSVNGQCHW